MQNSALLHLQTAKHIQEIIAKIDEERKAILFVFRIANNFAIFFTQYCYWYNTEIFNMP